MLSNFNSSIENAWKSQNLTQVKGVTYDIKGISFSTKRKKKDMFFCNIYHQLLATPSEM